MYPRGENLQKRVSGQFDTFWASYHLTFFSISNQIFPNSMENLISYLGKFCISFEKIIYNTVIDSKSWLLDFYLWKKIPQSTFYIQNSV